MNMGRLIFNVLLLYLFFCAPVLVRTLEEGNIQAEISSNGLDFVKDLLIEKMESSLVPLELPKLEKYMKIPILGYVKVVLTNITIKRICVSTSTVRFGDAGIILDISDATAIMGMNWKYKYSTRSWFLPIEVTDMGSASIQVDGLDIGLTLSLKTFHGSLELSPLECGCHVNQLSIKLDGGASWLYQGLINAFEDKISAAVEVAVSNKIQEAVGELDSFLQSLPKYVPVTDIATLNVTFVQDPNLNESSLKFEINGLFSPKSEVVISSQYRRDSQASLSCNEADVMTKVLLHEDVLKSASSVYFEAGKMHWIVDKVPDQSLLNTDGWRFIIPNLYKMYPHHDINLNVSISSLPIIKVEKQKIQTAVPLDVVINVLDVEDVIPVACISMIIDASTSAEIVSDAFVGVVKLNEFSMSLEWSKIGELHMRVIRTFTSTILRTVVLPFVNLKLGKGYRLPSFHGLELQDARILCIDSWIMICSDLASVN